MRMGKQVNFYAESDDINTLIEFVILKKSGCCLSGRAGTGSKPVIEQFAGFPARGNGWQKDSFETMGLAAASGFNFMDDS